MIRKQLFVATQMFLLDYPKIQAYLNAAVTGIVLLYLIINHPFKTKLLNATFIIGELCIFSVFLISIGFTYTDSKDLIDLCEKMCNYTIYSCVGIQLIISFLAFTIEIKEGLIEFYNQKNEVLKNISVEIK